MALTTSQKITLFEIIDTPYTGDADEMYGKFGLSALTSEIGNDSKVQLKILSRIASLTTDEETVLLTYISRWQSIGTQVWQMDGGVGGVDGMSFSPDNELMRIRERVKILIPVRHYWETVEQSAAKANSGSSLSQTTIR